MATGPTKDLGPCVLEWGGTDLGKTHGGCKFRYSEEDAGVFEDQQGTDSIDDIIVGGPTEFEAPLTRTQLSVLAALMAGATGSGTSGTTMTIKATVGVSRYDRAQELIIKPVLENGGADPNTSTWLHIFKASPKANYELAYDNTGQRVYNTMFKGYSDQTTTGIAALRKWRIGPAIA